MRQWAHSLILNSFYFFADTCIDIGYKRIVSLAGEQGWHLDGGCDVHNVDGFSPISTFLYSPQAAPLLVVVRTKQSILSWQIPLVFQGKGLEMVSS